jgi:coenzyme PQQ biosynthesis protein PqqD
MKAVDAHSKPSLAPGARLQTDRVTGGLVLLSPEGIQVLNDSAHAIIARCDGKQTVEEIAAALAEEYDAPVEALREDVIDCLVELHGKKLIVVS